MGIGGQGDKSVPYAKRPCVGFCYILKMKAKGIKPKQLEAEVENMRKRRPCIGLCHRNRVAKAKGFARIFVEAPKAGGKGEEGERKRGEEREIGEGESFGESCGEWQRYLDLQKLNPDEENFNRRILCPTLMLLEMSPITKETNKTC